MEEVLLLVVVVAPLGAALGGIGRRGLWFGLSALALLLAFASVVISIRVAPPVLEASQVGEAPAEKSLALLRECREDPVRYRDSCAQVEGIGGLVREMPETPASRAAGLLTAAFLGFLLAGVFYRGQRAAEPQSLPTSPAPVPMLSSSEVKAPKKLTVDTRVITGVVVLDLKGSVVLGEACDSLRDHILQLLKRDQKNILLNLQGVVRMDSAGIGVLIAGVVETAKAGGQLKLLNVPRLIHNVLAVHRLLSVFEVYADENQAISSFNAT